MSAPGHIYPPGVWVKHQGFSLRGTCLRCDIPIPQAGPQGRAGYWTRDGESRETAPDRDVPCFPAPPGHRRAEAAIPRCDWHEPLEPIEGQPPGTRRCDRPGRMQWSHQDGRGSLGHYCHPHAVRMAEITLQIMRDAAARAEASAAHDAPCADCGAAVLEFHRAGCPRIAGAQAFR